VNFFNTVWNCCLKQFRDNDFPILYIHRLVEREIRTKNSSCKRKILISFKNDQRRELSGSIFANVLMVFVFILKLV